MISARTKDFYVSGLGFAEEDFCDQRSALLFGDQKFNLHEARGKPIRCARPKSPRWDREALKRGYIVHAQAAAVAGDDRPASEDGR